MFTITTGQADKFQQPDTKAILAKPFPFVDAYRFNQLLKEILAKLEPFNEQAKRILEQYNCTIEPSGKINFPNSAAQINYLGELQKLYKVKIELTGEKIRPSLQWPSLTIAEVNLLEPLLEVEKDGKEDEPNSDP